MVIAIRSCLSRLVCLQLASFDITKPEKTIIYSYKFQARKNGACEFYIWQNYYSIYFGNCKQQLATTVKIGCLKAVLKIAKTVFDFEANDMCWLLIKSIVMFLLIKHKSALFRKLNPCNFGCVISRLHSCFLVLYDQFLTCENTLLNPCGFCIIFPYMSQCV